MNWFTRFITKHAQRRGLYDLSQFYEPLKEYMQSKFAEYDKDQLLMFGLTHDDLVDGIISKVLSVPIFFDPADSRHDKPYGSFDGQKWFMHIGGVDKLKYEKSPRYQKYVDSVIFHELVHGINYVRKLWDSVDYDPMMLGNDYYGHPEEQRAYKAQFEFLHRFLGLKPGISTHIMNYYSGDPSKERRDWINTRRLVNQGFNMSWFNRVLQKEARRFRSDDRVRFFTNSRKGKGRGLVHTPPMSYGRVVDWDSANKRYRVVDNRGQNVEVHPRNIVPDGVSRPTPEPLAVDPVEVLT